MITEYDRGYDAGQLSMGPDINMLEAEITTLRKEKALAIEALERIAKNGHSDQPEKLWGDPHEIARDVLAKASGK